MAVCLAVAVMAALAGATAARAEAVRTPYVEAELLPGSAAAVPGTTLTVALRQKIKPGWHTYWRNPGDSGEPTRIAWTLPEGWSAGDIVWPAPERQPIGPLVNYGYSNEVLLPVAIRIPANARPGETVRLTAVVDWLVCEKICIPEQVTLTLDLPVAAGPATPHPEHGQAVRAALARAPLAGVLTGVAAMADGKVKLAALGAPVRGGDVSDAYFFPYDGGVVDHAKPQRVERGPEGLTLTMEPGYATAAMPLSGPVEGVLSVGGKAYEVKAALGTLPAAAAGRPATGGGGGPGLLVSLAFAFLGGLILNLMPCVFPVLSMKAASLAGHAHEPRTARVQGLAFLAGVLTTFLALAGVLIAARAAGENAGWGFQLQSPPVIAALALLMLLVALNMSGVFHIGTSAQGIGSGLSRLGGAAGAFFTGVLAVVVAAPCTAPFMAAAIGYAVVQPAVVALAVFAALGLGLAAPFVLVSFTPALLRRLPRPGAWMETLQRALAFPMYAAAAWLMWIFARQTGVAGLAELFAAAWLLALAAWLFGRSQHSGRPLFLRAGAGVAAALVAGWLAIAAFGAPGAKSPTSAAAIAEEAWTPERVEALRAEGKPVFVNFTADWCVTCKVNERVALSSPDVSRAFARTGVTYLKADWTSRDPVIAETLAQHGRAGVPLYLLYTPGSPEPRILPQLLTPGAVIEALEAASPKT